MAKSFQLLRQQVAKRTRQPHSQKYAEQVSIYTAAMLRELDANMYKGNYRDLSTNDLLIEIQKHLDKLRLTVNQGGAKKTRVLEYAADVGNLCFMLADVTRCLDMETLEKRRAEKDYISGGF